MMKKILICLMVIFALPLLMFFGCDNTPELRDAVVTLENLSQIYDGTAKNITVNVELADSGNIEIIYSINGTQVTSPINAGTYDIQVNYTSDKYKTQVLTEEFVITKKEISLSDVVFDAKTYDGTRTLTVNDFETVGIVGEDEVSVNNLTASLVSANAGVQAVTLTGELAGNAKDNYSLKTPLDLTTTVSKKKLTVTGLSIFSKNDDGNTTASYEGTAELSGIIGEENVDIQIDSAVFADKNYGYNKAVTINATLTGTDKDNYILDELEYIANIFPIVNNCVLKANFADEQIVSYYVSSYVGTGTDVVIPEELDGKPVVSIADWAFIVNKDIISLQISANLEHIGFNAFRDSTIATITYADRGIDPKPLSLGETAFFGAPITNLTIPGYVNFIGVGCFQNTAELQTVVFEENKFDIEWGISTVDFNSWTFAWSGVDSIVFNGGITEIPKTFAQNADIKSVTLSEGIEKINFCAFIGSQLNTVNFPSTLKYIEEGAFKFSKITSIELNQGLEFIGTHAFHATSLTGITIPKTVTRIGDGAFGETATLTSIVFEEGGTNPLVILPFAFVNTSATEITIIDRISYIGWASFANIDPLITVTFLQGTGSNSLIIGSDAFDICPLLTAVTLADRVTAYASNAFDEVCVITNGGEKAAEPSDAVFAIPE